MLVLGAVTDDKFYIGDDGSYVMLVRDGHGRTRLGFQFPREVVISREVHFAKEGTDNATHTVDNDLPRSVDSADVVADPGNET